MFGWLAKMLMQTPVASSGCACCEAKREKLEKIRQQLTGEDTGSRAESNAAFPQSFSSGSFHAEIKSDGTSRAEIRAAAEKPKMKENCGCGCDGENCDGSGTCGHCSH